MPNFKKRIPYAVFFLHAQRQCYLINTVKGEGNTDAEGHKVPAPLHHVRYASTNVCDPARDGLKFLIEDVHAAMNIGDNNAIRRGRDS